MLQKDRVITLKFPTPLHEQAAEIAYGFFQPQAAVDSLLVVNSCARGQAVPESDLDMAVLVRPESLGEEVSRLEGLWRQELAANSVLVRYQAGGKMSHIHLDLVRGQYIPETWDDGGGPNDFELGIGNQLAYNKWIRMQVEEWLGLPELYHALPSILSVSNIESRELVEKANTLKILLEEWV